MHHVENKASFEACASLAIYVTIQTWCLAEVKQRKYYSKCLQLTYKCQYIAHTNRQHSEFDALFTYNTFFIEMHPASMSWILASYKADSWWAQLQLQIQANNNLKADTAILLFVIGLIPPIDSNPYLTPRPGSDKDLCLSFMDIREILKRFPTSNKSKLFYHINKLTNV